MGSRPILLLLLTVPLLSAAPRGLAAEVPLIERETLFGNPERAQARLSPDGSTMSFLAPLDGVMNVWVAPTGKFEQARPITADAGRGISQHEWAPNGTHVLFLQDKGGDENFHVFSAEVTTGEVRDLTPLQDTRATLDAVSWRHPDEVLIGLNDRDPQFHDAWRVNVKTGEKTLVEKNERFAGYVADRDLQVRLALEPLPDGGIAVLKKSPDGWQPFYRLPAEDVVNSEVVGFDADGDSIYLLTSEGRDKAALVRMELADGARSVMGQSDRADVSQVLLHPVSGKPQAFAAEHLKKRWTALDPELKSDLERLRERLAGSVEIVDQTRDNRLWVVAHDAPTDPLSYYLFDREAGTLDRLFASRPALAARSLQPMHAQVLKARDGLELTTYLTLPPGTDADGDGTPQQPVPLVLAVHGGPWARDSYGYSAWHQWLANRGYAVLSVNYRGSSGLGKSFIEKATGQFSLAMHDDLIDAVNWAVEGKIADARRVAVMGGSYGGYATLVGLTFTPERFACGVDIVGPSNLVTLIESFPAYWAPMLEATWYSRVGDPRNDAGRKRLEAQSPLFRVGHIEAPLLIGQGANDPRVTQRESEQLVSAMQGRELPVTYVLYPDEGHGFARPQNRLSFYAITEAFLAHNCLEGRFQPIGGDLAGSSTQVPAGAANVPGLEAVLADHQPVVAN